MPIWEEIQDQYNQETAELDQETETPESQGAPEDADPEGQGAVDDPQPEPEEPAEEPEDQPEPPAPGPPREHQGWARLRQERDEAMKRASALSEIAQMAGLPSEDALLERIREAKLRQDAAARGIPEDVARELHELKQTSQQTQQQLQQTVQQSAQSQYATQVESFIQREGIDQNALDSTWKWIADNGLYDTEAGVPKINVEAAYRAANFDKLVEQQAKKLQQQTLEQKRARQKSAPVPHGGGTAPQQTQNQDLTDDEFYKMAKAHNLGFTRFK